MGYYNLKLNKFGFILNKLKKRLKINYFKC